MTANLLSMLQGLTAPDWGVDAEIYALLGGAPHTTTAGGRTVPLIKRGDPNSWPAFTASLDAAVALCERVLPGWDGFAPINATGEAWVWPAGGMSRGHRANGPTPAIALLIAILTALEARDAG